MTRGRTESFWCPRCKRAFPSDVPDDYVAGQVIEEVGELCLDEDGNEWWRCPYPDCGAHTVHCVHWPAFRQGRPDYPVFPAEGVRYP